MLEIQSLAMTPGAGSHLHSAGLAPPMPPSEPGHLAHTCMGTLPHWGAI
jgi:hypothetical protein